MKNENIDLAISNDESHCLYRLQFMYFWYSFCVLCVLNPVVMVFRPTTVS
jgi:hypothetical protein